MLGSVLGIACALIWSFSVILFKKAGDHIHPVALNLLKNTLALILLVPTVLLIEGPNLNLPTGHLLILLASGFLGIGLADAMVLRSLNLVGASRIAILECLYSPFVIVFSLVFLGEELTAWRIGGTILVLAAIVCVSIKRESHALSKETMRAGVLWGATGVFAMAVGIVMIKPLFDYVPLFWMITIRMLAGVAGSVGVFLLIKNKRDVLREITGTSRKFLVFTACILSTYVAMIFWVAGYKYNDAAVTAVLNQTSTIFTVIFASILLKEKLTLPKLAGTVLAMTGVIMMTLG